MPLKLVKREFGEDACNYTRSLLQGQKVRLLCDQERYDKYGRTLAYVYLEDGTFVNARLMKEGYARVMSIKPNTTHANEFETLQVEAQKGQRGIWANPPPNCAWRGERIIKQWYFSPALAGFFTSYKRWSQGTKIWKRSYYEPANGPLVHPLIKIIAHMLVT
ncbi:thermonuclease family protein [Pelotomaculum sp. PtaB.Bin117]|uniref:thermonuclease family protein n=1 Tax=Pelotomaculum sp. PtaB.Bin117 TaxID=1811694 RepID=UPI002579F7B7|nr:thermonuclease family protein [Pelotomaculum sp. PtaB.Bin117]